MLKHRGQKSWPQSSEMGSRGLSRQMEQAGGSRGAVGRDPSPSSSLGNGVWDLGAAVGGRGAGTPDSGERGPRNEEPWMEPSRVSSRPGLACF